MLSWSNQKDWSREQATSKRELVMLFQVIFLVVLSCKQWSRKYEARQPQQKIVHLIINGSQIYMVEDLIYQLAFIICLHQAYNWTSHCYLELNWNLIDYPLLQHSKGIIVMCMIISSLTNIWLVHIVHA